LTKQWCKGVIYGLICLDTNFTFTRVITMTNTPPDPQSSQRTALGFDEFIAILVAFATIGAVLFWAFSRRDSGWNFSVLPLPSPTASVAVPPTTQIQPNANSNLNIVPSAPPATVNEPTLVNPSPSPGTIPTLILPFPVAPAAPPHVQMSPSANSFPEPFRVVTPSEQKSTIPPPIAFSDVPNDLWARRFINVLSSRGIIKGFPDYSFRPNQPVTRAEFAAILEQGFNKQLGTNAIAFNDIPSKYWATPAINQAISTGFLKGYPDKTFKPEQKISRVQVLVALVSGLNLKEPTSADKTLSVYKDVKDIPKYAIGKTAAATANNLVVNYPDPNTFAPNKEATRAEVAAMVHQALVRMGRLQPIESKNIVRSPQ
jgi:S-layer homology domain